MLSAIHASMANGASPQGEKTSVVSFRYFRYLRQRYKVLFVASRLGYLLKHDGSLRTMGHGSGIMNHR